MPCIILLVLQFLLIADLELAVPDSRYSHEYKDNKISVPKSNYQTCHSMEMKNLDLTNKKSGFGEKNRDHGQIGYKKKYLTQRGDYL